MIAPHIVSNDHILQIQQKFSSFQPTLYSQEKTSDLTSSRVLIIDSIGILSHLYRYGKIAYIGGGFGVGIHNVLEAATYGLPVIFGPNYQRFQEAVGLKNLGAAFTINSSKDCIKAFHALMDDNNYYSKIAEISRDFVKKNAGATQKVLEKAKEYL